MPADNFNTTTKESKLAAHDLGPIRFQGLVDYLRGQIVSGALAAGDRLPTFTELQARFATTPSTVNRALMTLEQEGLVVRERRRGVFVADPQTKVRQHAIGLAGFDVKTIQSSYWLRLLDGIQEVLHREDLEMVLIRPGSSRGLDRIDALLFHGSKEYDVPAIGRLMPMVAVMEKLDGIPAVVSDDFEGMRLATKHLLQLGHRRIACLKFLKAPINQIRLAGYRSALAERSIEANSKWVRDLESPGGSSLREMGYLRIQQWLAEDWAEQGCTALLCQNDAVAVGAMQAFRDAGLNVPVDVSVIGYDGTEEGEFSTPHLTSIEVPLQQIGKTAAETLLRQLSEVQPQELSLSLPVQLIVRDSTAPVRT